ncbi:hypothetical protein [Anaerocolumna sp.]|uniref:hypothetical protein n=1 Tax=Anaerocolumna sp. TaxID=2041569 RepID=UPI0028AAA775|nr:hypothetical protein [Anaerocolumna sp.]
MKRAKVLMLLLISALLFSACNGGKQSAKEIPDDFGFVYTHNFTEVDTFNSTIKNRFQFDEGDPNAITDFNFSDEQLQKIYEAFIKYDLHDLPEEIDPDKGYMAIPPSYYEFQYVSDGETKSISCSTGAHIDQKGISKANNKFVKFMTEVWEYVHESDAYERLPSGPQVE